MNRKHHAVLLLLTWLIPGSGFMLRGRSARGITQFVLVLATFVAGLLLHAGVAWPQWSPSAPDFNLINNFTFLVQMGAGLPALVSLLGSLKGWPAGGVPWHAYYDLGAYFMIVAGTVNFFAISNFYDRLIHLHPRFEEQEAKGTVDHD